MAKIKVALVGAGIWARDQHLPAILKNTHVELVAIYSRSEASASKLAETVADSIAVYYDTPETPGKNLDSLLSRKDIDAIIVCLPILVQLDIVKRCLEAGKHVQSEKPIAGDTATAAKFIRWYRDAQKSGSLDAILVWAVAEEFRLMPALNDMANAVAQLGKVQTFYAQGYSLIKQGSPWYETSWRKVPGYQGGFLLDGGVHWTSALLHVLGKNNRPTSVAAYTALSQPHLAPVDTVNAVVRIPGGTSGIFAYSAGIEHKAGPRMYFEVVCEGGSVIYQPSTKPGMAMVTVSKAGQEDSVQEYDSSLNTQYELATFVSSIQKGQEELEGTPERALDDLEFMQKMLESGAADGKAVDLVYTS